MAPKPAEEAKYALNFGVSRSDLSPEAQAEYDRLAPDYSRAQHERREEDRRTQNELVRRLAGTAWFPDLGMAVREGNVYRHGVSQNGSFSPPLAYRERRGAGMQLLGALAGARAEVVAGKAGSRRSGGQRAGDAAALTLLLGPVGLLAAASRAGAGVAVVMFADGSSGPQILLRDKPSLTKAQLAAVQFNALAAAPAGFPAAARDGFAPELERTAGRQLSGPELSLVRLEELRDKVARALAAGGSERERDKLAEALRRLDARIAERKKLSAGLDQAPTGSWPMAGSWPPAVAVDREPGEQPGIGERIQALREVVLGQMADAAERRQAIMADAGKSYTDVESVDAEMARYEEQLAEMDRLEQQHNAARLSAAPSAAARDGVAAELERLAALHSSVLQLRFHGECLSSASFVIRRPGAVVTVRDARGAV